MGRTFMALPFITITWTGKRPGKLSLDREKSLNKKDVLF
jgi:hypothetical protein